MKHLYFFIMLYLFAACGQSNEQAAYYSIDDFDQVEKIDVHVHIRTERDAFVEQARKDNFKLLTVVVDHSAGIQDVREQFKYGMYQANAHSEDIACVTAFSMKEWDEPDWTQQSLEWLDSCFDAGAIGMKVWKNIGMVQRDKSGDLVMIDDPKLDTIFSVLAHRNIPVMGHLGEPKNCWLPVEQMTTNNDKTYFTNNPQYHMYKHPEMPSYEEQIAARDRMLEKNPELTFIGAHMASLEWSVDELAKRLDQFPNMSVDMAARMGQLFYQTQENREKVRDFFIKYQDRLLYATDMGDDGDESREELQESMHNTWLRDWQYFTTEDSLSSNLIEGQLQGLRLPREVVNKIYKENARTWFSVFQ
ncbi:amidohydrolase family protein [Catalinimonas niigatensis]|uniref:amidohydrolase family protein n=1 Tax=Catalinimonas niigatensis TaxID=1397264 RepID=UPI002665A6AB|nr:amidohydrolase family protein [Catalinimonas niigatensis]WPP50986.1 amidohydrolase family protein [Catalinimonas niigatensis]